MTKISNEYGQWLSEFNWSHIVTIRLHYKLTELQSYNLGQRIINCSKNISRLFYSVEKDRQDNMNHMHLIIESMNPKLTRKQLANDAGFGNYVNAVSYFQKADSKRAVSNYCSKYVGKPEVYHDYLEAKK